MRLLRICALRARQVEKSVTALLWVLGAGLAVIVVVVACVIVAAQRVNDLHDDEGGDW